MSHSKGCKSKVESVYTYSHFTLYLQDFVFVCVNKVGTPRQWVGGAESAVINYIQEAPLTSGFYHGIMKLYHNSH